MKVSKIAAVCAAITLSTASMAGVVLSEGFDNVAALGGAGWAQVNASTNPKNPYFQGNSGIFPAASGAADSYVAADFLSGSPMISNWLMTPVLTFGAMLDVNFQARVAGGGYLDTINVWLSGNASSTAVGDFTTFLGSYSSNADEGWVAQNFSALTAAGATGRLAFQYFVADTNVDGNYIGIDSLTATTVPEPTSLALAGLGLAGLVLSRRRRA